MEAKIFATWKKALFHLSRISRMKRFLSKPALAQLLHAFVLSTPDCNNSLLVGCPESKLRVLQKVQNWAARFATGCNRRDHITPYLKSLYWLPVFQRIDFKITLLMLNCLNETTRSYLTSLVTRYEPPSSFRRLSFGNGLVLDLNLGGKEQSEWWELGRMKKGVIGSISPWSFLNPFPPKNMNKIRQAVWNGHGAKK